MRIAFFDHVFHEKTKSSNFFLDIIKNIGEIEVFYANFQNGKRNEILTAELFCRFDLLIFWQVIPPAAVISQIRHSRIVLIPMYDACCTMTYPQWYAYRQCHFVSFSKKMHTLFCNLRMHSLYVRYVPPIVSLGMDRSNENLKAFVWRRTVSLNTKTLFQSLKAIGVKTIVLHDSPDNVSAGFLADGMIEGIEIIRTNGWFRTHDEYLELVTECDIYVAPRCYEGIGLSFLEAMGLGLCVFAPNQATMNEYIADGYNGVLFDSFKTIGDRKLDIKAIKKQSKISFQIYSEEWKRAVLDICPFLLSIDGRFQNRYRNPYLFIVKDIIMLFEIRIFPFLKRKLGMSDY